MKKDSKKAKSNEVRIMNLAERKYQPKGPKTTTTAILSKQLRDLPLEERAKFIESLGARKRKSKDSDKG